MTDDEQMPRNKKAIAVEKGDAISLGTDDRGSTLVGLVEGVGAPIFHDGTWVIRVQGLDWPLRPPAEALIEVWDASEINVGQQP